MTRRLQADHPDKQAFEQLVALADKLGISISFLGTRTIVEVGSNEYDLEAFEDSSVMYSFPPPKDYNLVQGRD